ncbi:MAG: site-2 protease family protein [Dehalococcoidia bacterium]|nr:site-2 protease family protein [Dehalococcoidia bacterium]MDW8119737.1 M50 family metallopeptidase [Chloroflexota bacterium]
MGVAVTILIFIGVLAVLILVHELGHFVTARLFGVRVLEFGIGYPPRLVGIRWGETLYSLNLLPLGGFVRLEGEEAPTSPRSLASKGILTRFTILIAGSAMNALLPLVIFSALFMVPTPEVQGKVAVVSVAPDSPAAKAGLKPGDIILSIDGHPIRNNGDLSRLVRLNLGRPTVWEVERPTYLLTQPIGGGGEFGGGRPPVAKVERFTTVVTPRWRFPEGQGPTGILVRVWEPQVVQRSEPFWRAVPLGAVRLWEVLILFRNEVIRAIIGGSSFQFAGPIGIAQATGEVAQLGWMALLQWTALLSLNLAILNVLPIPMLDGGRLLFLAIEFVRRGKRISPQREGLVHFIGFIVLLLFIVIVSYFDIVRLLRGENLIR